MANQIKCPNCGHPCENITFLPGLDIMCPRCFTRFMPAEDAKSADTAPAVAPSQPEKISPVSELPAFQPEPFTPKRYDSLPKAEPPAVHAPETAHPVQSPQNADPAEKTEQVAVPAEPSGQLSAAGNFKEALPVGFSLPESGKREHASANQQVSSREKEKPDPCEDEIVLTLEDNVPLDLLPVEAGTFIMGKMDENEDPDKIPHEVTLTKHFWIGKYPVTWAQYESVMGIRRADSDTDKEFPATEASWYGDSNFYEKLNNRLRSDKGFPVTEVSWYDACKFCEKLNMQLREDLPAGYELRLPTEAEWEYAARGGRKSKGCKYSGSNDFDAVAKRYLEAYYVGQNAPNELGIYDMSGNVWEWCLDCYEEYPEYEVTDPVRVTGFYRVNRGGGTNGHIKVTDRGHEEPTCRLDYLGFRIALAPVCGKPPTQPPTINQEDNQPASYVASAGKIVIGIIFVIFYILLSLAKCR